MLETACEAAQRQFRRVVVPAGMALTLVVSTMPAQAARGHSQRHAFGHAASCHVNAGVGYGDIGVCHGPGDHRGHKVG